MFPFEDLPICNSVLCSVSIAFSGHCSVTKRPTKMAQGFLISTVAGNGNHTMAISSKLISMYTVLIYADICLVPFQ